MKIRQPICTVAGHVDHGKTSLLDSIRSSSVAEGEAGAITQKISFTSFTADKLKVACPLIDKKGIKLDIPGFLFIDTPGHAAFNNLRKRGGSLADLAILVIDINEGIKPQTAEVIQILKQNKTPFIIALNKIDKINGWNSSGGELEMSESIERQPIHVRQMFDEKIYTLMASIQNYGFDPELYYKITDFTKQIAMVPCSAKTHEGIPEILMVLCGLSQKFLKQQLMLGNKAKGVILEIKKDKNLNYIESILYDGVLSVGQEIAIATFENAIITKVKSIHVIQPLSVKFSSQESVSAAAGIRLQLGDKIDVLPGMPFMTFDKLEDAEKEFKKEIAGNIELDKKGVIIKADSLGSLEAMLVLLRESNIKVVKAGIGSINKTDILSAKANLNIDALDAVVLGFNVGLDEEANELSKGYGNIKVICDEVIYKLIENFQKFREEKNKEIEKSRLMELSRVCKLEILHQYVFHNSNPAIFGVKIVAGDIVSGMEVIDNNNEVIGRIKNIQADGKGVEEAKEGMEVAISIPGVTFDRHLKDMKYLYSEISEKQFKKFKDNRDLLSSSEISALQEIKQIKQTRNSSWGG
ncbi:MAG TPA: translation initiation factor IF-2 [Candidatus Nanoarchaeia archaeon]|nr:translation initiation factor IF-2 [Candidatus Nanoarchaeia archaeon]